MLGRRRFLMTGISVLSLAWSGGGLSRQPIGRIVGKVVTLEWKEDNRIRTAQPVDLWLDTESPDIEGEIDPWICPSWEASSDVRISSSVHERLVAAADVRYSLVVHGIDPDPTPIESSTSWFPVDRSRFGAFGLNDTVVLEQPILGESSLSLVADRPLDSIPDESARINLFARYSGL